MKELSITETSLVSGGVDIDMDTVEFVAFLGMGTFLGAVLGASIMTGISLISLTDSSSVMCKSISYAIGGAALGTLPGSYLGMLFHAFKTKS